MSPSVRFRAQLWRYAGDSAWHFVTVPKDETEQLRRLSAGLRNAFGSVRVAATIGNTTWRTSVFFDSKAGAYLLPVKADVRRKEGIGAGDDVEVALELDL